MSNIQDIKKMMLSYFNAEAADGVNAIFQLNLKDDKTYYIKIENKQFEVNTESTDDPDVILTTDENTLKGIIDGSINGMQAFMTGKIKFSGDMSLAMKLKTLFSSQIDAGKL